MPNRNAWTRREALGALGAALAVAGPGRSGAADAASVRNIIDVHAHYQPPAIRALNLPGPMNAWDLQKQIDDMDAAGVTRALLSITTPGVPATGEASRRIARESNEYAAKLAADHGRRFGFFSCVPMDDPDAALQELAYGFDVLKAQGVGLFTSYAGSWLGDARFDPLFAELDRRGAVVFVHPTSAACCTRLMPEVADTLIEYGTDTTRAIASYVYRGAAHRFQKVRMIWSHSGGTMPYLIERFDGADRSPAAKAQAPEGFRASIARFWYDIAQSSNPVATRALRSVVPMERIVFGTDYPFRSSLDHVQGLERGGVFDRRELAGIYRGNLAASLPQLT
ncbi:MAG TPA: amidohydrolase family protein [Steroidobacteraceae bacterium]|nr:amidohydrolase family protein [Steroidobacteraceae bacterium]